MVIYDLLLSGVLSLVAKNIVLDASAGRKRAA